MDATNALKLIRKAVDEEIPRLKALNHSSNEYPLWRQKLKDILGAAFGANSDEYQRFAKAVMSAMLGGTERALQQEYIDHLTQYEVALKSIIQKYEILGLEASPVVSVERIRPRIFITHGGHTHNRDLLELFLWRSGYRPIIVEEAPTLGMNPDAKVDHYLEQCSFAVVLCEKDRASLQDGKLYPRANVMDELARVRKTLDNKFILLLENGLALPSNEAGAIVWEPFSPESVDQAFGAVERDLKAHGIVGVSE